MSYTYPRRPLWVPRPVWPSPSRTAHRTYTTHNKRQQSVNQHHDTNDDDNDDVYKLYLSQRLHPLPLSLGCYSLVWVSPHPRVLLCPCPSPQRRQLQVHRATVLQQMAREATQTLTDHLTHTDTQGEEASEYLDSSGVCCQFGSASLSSYHFLCLCTWFSRHGPCTISVRQ